MTPRFSRLLRTLTCYTSALLLLVLGGLALRPLTTAQRGHEEAQGLLNPGITTTAPDALSSRLAVFTLGGLRSLAAEILAMDATSAWLQQDWPRAKKRWEQITTLCPTRANYWARAARDMSKNAVAHVYGLKGISEHERATMAQEYLYAAEDFYRIGIRYNPDNILLHLELASFYEDLARKPQFAKAVDTYKEALRLGASEMYRRWVFYNLCRIRGREQEAWQLGLQLLTAERHRTPSVLCLIYALQHKLNIPAAMRLTPEQLFGTEAKARKQLRSYLHNTLRFPTNGVAEYLQGMKK